MYVSNWSYSTELTKFKGAKLIYSQMGVREEVQGLVTNFCDDTQSTNVIDILKSLAQFAVDHSKIVDAELEKSHAWKKIMKLTTGSDGFAEIYASEILDSCLGASAGSSNFAASMGPRSVLDDDVIGSLEFEIPSRGDIRSWFIEQADSSPIFRSVFSSECSTVAQDYVSTQHQNKRATNSESDNRVEPIDGSAVANDEIKSVKESSQFPERSMTFNVAFANNQQKRCGAVPLTMWPCSHLLAHVLLSCPEFVKGKRVLELGSGFHCVPGAAAECSGARGVFCTEIDSTAIDVMNVNIDNNGLDCVSATRLDWTKLDDYDDLGQFDVILGSDIIHEKWMSEAVELVVSRFLKKDGLCLIVNGHANSRLKKNLKNISGI